MVSVIVCLESLKPLLYQGKMEESKSVEESKADLSESLILEKFTIIMTGC